MWFTSSFDADPISFFESDKKNDDYILKSKRRNENHTQLNKTELFGVWTHEIPQILDFFFDGGLFS